MSKRRGNGRAGLGFFSAFASLRLWRKHPGVFHLPFCFFKAAPKQYLNQQRLNSTERCFGMGHVCWMEHTEPKVGTPWGSGLNLNVLWSLYCLLLFCFSSFPKFWHPHRSQPGIEAQEGAHRFPDSILTVAREPSPSRKTHLFSPPASSKVPLATDSVLG